MTDRMVSPSPPASIRFTVPGARFVVSAMMVAVFPNINPMIQTSNNRFITCLSPSQIEKCHLVQILIVVLRQSIQDGPTSR